MLDIEGVMILQSFVQRENELPRTVGNKYQGPSVILEWADCFFKMTSRADEIFDRVCAKTL